MAIYDYNEVKKELQGSKGLIKKIRSIYIPDTIKMSEIAQYNYEIEYNRFDNIDFALDKLLFLEYDIYLEKQKKVIESFVEYADSHTTFLDYPITRSIIDEYKRRLANGENPTIVLNGITKIIIALADSNRQSRVSRSGSSLMHHISYLLIKNNFIFQEDFQREYVLKEGCKLDFFFPSISVYNSEPKNCCSVACQTTSNDRFRLTFAQMPSDTRNRACTAIGNSNFGVKLGPDSLSDNKLDEAKKNGVKFVIFEHAIDDRLSNSRAVMSYNEWFAELKAIKQFW